MDYNGIFITFMLLSESVKNSIRDLLQESSSFNVRDVLVDARSEHSKLYVVEGDLSFSLDGFPKSILKEARETRKESGVNSLCLADGIALLSFNGKEVFTPILLVPLEQKVNKLNATVDFHLVENETFLNPFLQNYLANHDIVLDLEGGDLKTTILENLDKHSIQREEQRLIGNFHHHRYQVIKELEDLLESDQISPNVSSLLGFTESCDVHELTLPPDLLFPADTDHIRVFEQVQKDNTVVQGPPGTGKSQVLSNLVAKLIASNKTSIFVSEKRAALEVIEKKLSQFDLHRFSFIATSDKLSHKFLQSLKSTWDYLESIELSESTNLRLSEQYLDNLQMTLDLLGLDELIGGISYHDFKVLAKDIDLTNCGYSSDITSLKQYKDLYPIVEQVYEKEIAGSLGVLNVRLLQSKELNQLDQRIHTWISSIEQLTSIFKIESWSHLAEAMKTSSQCQVFENELYKKYAPIFQPDSRANKRFTSLRKKYLKAKLELEQMVVASDHWKARLSEKEAISLQQRLSTNGFLAQRRLKRRWQELSHLPFSEALDTIEEHLALLKKEQEYSQIAIKFCELGIEDPEKEVSLIHHTMGMFGEAQWEAIKHIPDELRIKITGYHNELHKLYTELKENFNLSGHQSLLLTLNKLLLDLPRVLEMSNKLKEFDHAGLLAFSRNECFADYIGEWLNSHWIQFKERFPMLSTFSMNDIKTKVDSIIEAKDVESKMFTASIEYQIWKRFKGFHELLNTPARKLSQEEKDLKLKLRKGKSILVKEFAKTRSHPSLRELYHSEARVWIQLLKPIWLSNPTQLAKCFPMEKELFDVAIFDEASQVPIQNALGAIQRSKRVVVAGDEHQMGPSSYFKTGGNETLDLLHQANYHWKSIPLKHHYRSVHPDLIRFSNTHFYEQSLNAYPALNAVSPLHFRFVKDGVFVNRQNIHEAKEIAQELNAKLKEDLSLSIGVVAFSEEQLKAIWKELSEDSKNAFSDETDTSKFFKSLENVQGDECDHLFISFGYGRNEENEFHLRFGPLNSANGRKRLNVLFTRARKSLHFFSSVRGEDFKMSDNESVNLLKQWFSFIEKERENDLLRFPFELKPQKAGETLNFEQIQKTLCLAEELVTLQQVLENRGWKLIYS